MGGTGGRPTGRPSGIDFRAWSRMIPPGQQIHLFGTERETTADGQHQRCRIRGQGAWVHDSGGESSGWAKASGTPREASRPARAWRRTRAAAKEASTARDWLTGEGAVVRVDGARLALSWSAAPATWYCCQGRRTRYGQGRLIGVYGVAPLWWAWASASVSCPPATLKIYACDGQAMAKKQVEAWQGIREAKNSCSRSPNRLQHDRPIDRQPDRLMTN